MHHTVFHLRNRILHRKMHRFRRPVGIRQAFGAVHGDLHIHINPGAEQPCIKQVNLLHAVNAQDCGTDFFRSFSGTGFIHQLIGGIPENFQSGLFNKNANNQPCCRIKNRKAQPGAQNPCKCAHRRKGVRAVMPGIRHERAGFDPACGAFCKPEHPFLNGNRNDRGKKRRHARNRK